MTTEDTRQPPDSRTGDGNVERGSTTWSEVSRAIWRTQEADSPRQPTDSGARPRHTERKHTMNGHALDGVLSDADMALAAALSVAVPSMLAEDAMQKAPGMIDHLRAQGFDVLAKSSDG